MRYVESLNQALHQLMSEDESVYVLGQDIVDPYGGAFKVSKGLATAFPDRVIATPISEAGITGFATGLAMRGLRPILEIMFGDFVTLCADQIINSACKFPWMYNEQIQVPLVIRTPMGGRRGYGPTHSQTLETIFLNVPQLTIVAPCNYHDPGALLRAVVTEEKSPVLFIENKLLYPKRLSVPDDTGMDGDFHVSRISLSSANYPTIRLCVEKNVLPEATLVAYGGMAPMAVKAAFNLFMREEIIIEVVLPSLVKPIPIEDIMTSVQKSRRLVTVEEAVRTSGWGAEVSCQVTEQAHGSLAAPVQRVGAKEYPIPCSRPLEDEVLPQVEDIERAVLALM